jgi:hypothetical protein
MPGTSTAKGPCTMCWNPNGHVTLISWTPALKPPQNPSLQLLCSALHFEKCARISNMPDTGAAIGPCIMCWKPKLSCHIEFMDTSNVSNPKRISTSPVLRTSLWEVFKNQQHAWQRSSDWSMYYVLETKTVMSHWIHWHQQCSQSKTHLYISCALYVTLRSVQESATFLVQVPRVVHV